MITIDSNNNIYSTNNGLDPVGAIYPVYHMFTSLGFFPNLSASEINLGPQLPPLNNITYKTTIINPWTYWTTEEKLQSIRLQRDYILQQTDWRAIRSYETGIPESQAWLDYRQELRDFPDVVDVNLPIQQIVWPTPPNS